MIEKVVLALMAKRAEIQGYIQDLETKARRWRARLAHVDATLTIFSPEARRQSQLRRLSLACFKQRSCRTIQPLSPT
jgi:hypothetical protein